MFFGAVRLISSFDNTLFTSMMILIVCLMLIQFSAKNDYIVKSAGVDPPVFKSGGVRTPPTPPSATLLPLSLVCKPLSLRRLHMAGEKSSGSPIEHRWCINVPVATQWLRPCPGLGSIRERRQLTLLFLMLCRLRMLFEEVSYGGICPNDYIPCQVKGPN